MSEALARKLLIDSNLLLLLLVGSFDARLIAVFKRTSQFSLEDFRLLREFSRPYLIATTPHVLTEVANLANSLPAHVRRPFLGYLAGTGSSFLEYFTPFAQLSTTPPFQIFGIADAAVCQVAATTVVLTEDSRLRSYLLAQGNHAINLADVRNLRRSTNAQLR